MTENDNIAEEVVSKLQQCLKELKIKTQAKSTKEEALIHGKFSHKSEDLRLVVHIRKEDYTPSKRDYGTAEFDDDNQEDCAQTPNLNFQSVSSEQGYTRKEGMKIKKKFLKEADKILPKLKR